MPLHRRLPKRGFRTPRSRTNSNEVNLGRIQQAIDAGKLDAAGRSRGGPDQGRPDAASQGRRAASGRRRDQGQGRVHGVRRLQVGGRSGRKGRRLGRNPGAEEAEEAGRKRRPDETRHANGACAGHPRLRTCRQDVDGRDEPGRDAQGAGTERHMVSAAEQLAANLNFSALAKAKELKKRICFTVGALLVYRLGTYIPLPGIDPHAWDAEFQHARPAAFSACSTCSPAAAFTAWRSSRSTSCPTSRPRSSSS